MLLSFLLAQLTISLPRRIWPSSKHSWLCAERPLAQPAPPGMLLSFLLAQLTLPGMLLSFLLAQLTVRLRQPN